MITDKKVYVAEALVVLEAFAKKNSHFLMEDVNNYGKTIGFDVPLEPRWWGGVAHAARAAGLIEKTDKYGLTKVGSRPQVIWKSKLT